MPGEAPQPLTLNHPASNPGRFSGRGSSFWCRGFIFWVDPAVPAAGIHHSLTITAGFDAGCETWLQFHRYGMLAFVSVAKREPGAHLQARARLPSRTGQVETRRGYGGPTTKSSRWIISARPEKPRIESISAEERPLIFCAS